MRYVFPTFVLLTGVSLSVVAAYYSVYGLTALFAGAAGAVLILGGVMEVAKLVLATSIHANWGHFARWQKVLMPVQLVALMLITSVGIFGFLSGAFIEHQSGADGPRLQIAAIESKITSQQETINRLTKERTALDAQVTAATSSMSSSIGEAAKLGRKNFSNAIKEVVTAQTKVRDQFTEQYARINTELAAAQAVIDGLQESKIPYQKSITESESKIGPLKYVAALLYENSDQLSTESAVRMMILLLMFVFDPLAVSLVVLGADGIARVYKSRHSIEPIETVKAQDPSPPEKEVSDDAPVKKTEPEDGEKTEFASTHLRPLPANVADFAKARINRQKVTSPSQNIVTAVRTDEKLKLTAKKGPAIHTKMNRRQRRNILPAHKVA